VWKLVGEVQEDYDPATQKATVVYGNPEQVCYGFTVIDPSHPLVEEELRTSFGNRSPSKL
jgi:hypothetical protein